MKILSSFVGERALSRFVSMGDVEPLRFGGGGVRAFVGAMVASVSVFVYSYRVEGPADSRCPKQSLAVGCPRGRRTAGRGRQAPLTPNCVSRRWAVVFRGGGRSREDALLLAHRAPEIRPGELSC